METIKTTCLTVFMVICAFVPCAFGFEGRITTAMTRGGETQTLLYTVGTNSLRIECLETDRPYPCDIIDLASGQLTLLYPHNRSFVRLPLADENVSATPPLPLQMPPPSPPAGMQAPMGPTNLPGAPNMPQMPPPPNLPAGTGPGAPTMAMPVMPPMPMEQVELKAMNDTTNILGYSCAHYVIHQREETMEIWATDQLMPFQPWLRNQPHRFGPQMIEEQWSGLLKAKKLFPLLAILKFPNGVERLRFEVTTIQPEKVRDNSLFQPPPDYQEIQSLPF